jgi:hypothetical protein
MIPVPHSADSKLWYRNCQVIGEQRSVSHFGHIISGLAALTIGCRSADEQRPKKQLDVSVEHKATAMVR